MLSCDQCGAKISDTANFCPFCGELAPQKTIIFSEENKEIKNPKYCPNCKEPNLLEALFCQNCGEKLHERPQKDKLYCGKCGAENKTNAKVCFNCGQNLDDWFAMQGDIAKELGYHGDLILTEKMNNITYRFLTKKIVTIGRNPQNDIIIPCNWVSGNHCYFDIKNKTFNDTSTNGTFINRKADRIKKESIEYVNEFNIADTFTFYTVKRENAFGFRLGAIQNEKECRNNGNGLAFDKLREFYNFLIWGDFEIHIQKLDGYIIDKLKAGVSYYTIKYKNGFYYYSDKEKNINNLLLLNNRSNLPKNWLIAK